MKRKIKWSKLSSDQEFYNALKCITHIRRNFTNVLSSLKISHGESIESASSSGGLRLDL